MFQVHKSTIKKYTLFQKPALACSKKVTGRKNFTSGSKSTGSSLETSQSQNRPFSQASAWPLTNKYGLAPRSSYHGQVRSLP